jgi:hypothetical protein
MIAEKSIALKIPLKTAVLRNRSIRMGVARK